MLPFAEDLLAHDSLRWPAKRGEARHLLQLVEAHAQRRGFGVLLRERPPCSERVCAQHHTLRLAEQAREDEGLDAHGEHFCERDREPWGLQRQEPEVAVAYAAYLGEIH
eukprot:1530193-Prymnesium_polylepis.1